MAERMTIDELLAQAREGLLRVEPHDAIGGRALLIDIRSESQRAVDGVCQARSGLRATCSSGLRSEL